jgi:hypothetical protein
MQGLGLLSNLGAALRQGWDDADGLQHPEGVEVYPHFGNLVVRNAKEHHTCDGGASASWGNVHERAGMRPLRGKAPQHFIAFSQQIVNGEVQVRKGCLKGADVLLQRLAAGD